MGNDVLHSQHTFHVWVPHTVIKNCLYFLIIALTHWILDQQSRIKGLVLLALSRHICKYRIMTLLYFTSRGCAVNHSISKLYFISWKQSAVIQQFAAILRILWVKSHDEYKINQKSPVCVILPFLMVCSQSTLGSDLVKSKQLQTDYLTWWLPRNI